MYKVMEKLLTPNEYSRPRLPLKGVLGLVIHYVANPMSSAMANRNFWEGRKDTKKDYGSAHYIIDLNGDVLIAVPPTEGTYHSGAKVFKPIVKEKLHGAPNSYTLGIECTHTDKTGKMTDATYRTLVELCVDLCKRFNLNPITDLYLHYDITGKDCHKWFIDNPVEWSKFKNLVVTTMKPPVEKIVIDDTKWNESATKTV